MEELMNTLAVVALANLAALPWAWLAWRKERPTKCNSFKATDAKEMAIYAADTVSQ